MAHFVFLDMHRVLLRSFVQILHRKQIFPVVTCANSLVSHHVKGVKIQVSVV